MPVLPWIDRDEPKAAGEAVPYDVGQAVFVMTAREAPNEVLSYLLLTEGV